MDNRRNFDNNTDHLLNRLVMQGRETARRDFRKIQQNAEALDLLHNISDNADGQTKLLASIDDHLAAIAIALTPPRSLKSMSLLFGAASFGAATVVQI